MIPTILDFYIIAYNLGNFLPIKKTVSNGCNSQTSKHLIHTNEVYYLVI